MAIERRRSVLLVGLVAGFAVGILLTPTLRGAFRVEYIAALALAISGILRIVSSVRSGVNQPVGARRRQATLGVANFVLAASFVLRPFGPRVFLLAVAVVVILATVLRIPRRFFADPPPAP